MKEWEQEENVTRLVQNLNWGIGDCDSVLQVFEHSPLPGLVVGVAKSS